MARQGDEPAASPPTVKKPELTRPATQRLHEGPVLSAAFLSADLVATGGMDRSLTICEWDRDQLRTLHQLKLTLRCAGVRTDGRPGRTRAAPLGSPACPRRSRRQVRPEARMADPMYRQIAEDLRQQIEAGELAEGTQLPTEIEFRETYPASRNTIRDAIKWLTNLGLVETRAWPGHLRHRADRAVYQHHRSGPGRRASAYPAEAQSGREATSSRTQVEVQRADNLLASELPLPKAPRFQPPSKSASSTAGHGRCRPATFQ